MELIQTWIPIGLWDVKEGPVQEVKRLVGDRYQSEGVAG